MLRKKENNSMESFDTLIGTNAIFEGTIMSEGTIRIDGKIKGDLKINGDVFIGNTGAVTGDVFANSVHIEGVIEGNVQAAGVLRILSTAKLYGDIKVHSFVADEGALFEGKCSMIEMRGSEKNDSKKSLFNRDYKKSSIISDEKNNEIQDK